jgi:hypothetical protein
MESYDGVQHSESLGLRTSSIVRNSRELTLFLSSGKGKDTYALLDPLERAHLNHLQFLKHCIF